MKKQNVILFGSAFLAYYLLSHRKPKGLITGIGNVDSISPDALEEIYSYAKFLYKRVLDDNAYCNEVKDAIFGGFESDASLVKIRDEVFFIIKDFQYKRMGETGTNYPDETRWLCAIMLVKHFTGIYIDNYL